MKDIIFPINYKTDTKGLKDAENGLTKLADFTKKAGIAVAAGLAVASAAAVAFAVSSAKAAAESEAITRGLENAAKNAGVFGTKATSIDKATEALDRHSTKLAELTGIDDEIINQIKTGWLAVPSLAALGTEGLNNLAQVVADTAAGTGKDVTAIGLAFQRVAGDTENAFSKLTRAGIVFTDEQKATFDSLLNTNGEMAAQAYLVEQLGQKYAGAAQAAANPFEQLKVIFENFKEVVGSAFLPALRDIVPVVSAQLNALASDPKFISFLQQLSEGFAKMLPDLVELLPPLTELALALLPALIALVPILTGFIQTITPGLRNMADAFKGATDDGSLWWRLLLKVFPVIDLVRMGVEILNSALGGFGGWIAGLFSPLVSIYNLFVNWNNIINTVINTLGSLLGINKNLPTPIATNLREHLNRIPMQAEGGITTRAGLSWVGEQGPELLNLPRGAQVIPLDRMTSGSGNTTNISFTVNAGMGTDGAAVGEQIVNAIRRYERTSGQVFARA